MHAAKDYFPTMIENSKGKTAWIVSIEIIQQAQILL
jgi:hypothetical protein